jgi:hypothetical protein
MDLRKFLSEEHYQHEYARAADFVGNNPKRFATLIDIFLVGPYRITQRASWPISICVEREPKLIKPHLLRILKELGQPLVHDAVRRNIVRLLQFIVIPKALQGRTIDSCFALLKDRKQPIAVRVFSMTVLSNLANEIPELKNELIPYIEDELPFGSAGFISRGKKILKALKA